MRVLESSDTKTDERQADESLYRSSVAVVKQLQRKLGKSKCPLCEGREFGERVADRREIHAVR